MKKSTLTLIIGLLISFFAISLLFESDGVEATNIPLLDTSTKKISTNIDFTTALTETSYLPFVQKAIAQSGQNGELLFISDRAEAEKYDIYKMNFDGSNVVRLTNFSIESEIGFNHRFLPRWSPDGSKFAVQIEGALYIYSKDGVLLDTLIDEPMMAVDGIPAWSPNGEKIAYMAKDCKVARPVCNEFSGGGVRVIDVQTKAITQSIPDGIHMYASTNIEWLPDGQTLLAVPHEGGGTPDGIIIGYLDGTPAQWILTNYIIEDFDLSANGQKVAFSANSNYRAYTADIDGNNVQKVFDGVSESAWVYHITWHPSGNQIAYAVSRNSGYDRTIYVANADGSGAKDILPSNHSLSLHLWGWTPDGSNIIFNSDKNRDWRHYDIYKANYDGSNLTNLTTNSPRDDKPADYFP